jgi:DNA-binding winged helix-turn-helix (wHTH) protein
MLYSFEDFVLDTDKQELCRARNRIRLEPQIFDLLEFLIRNRDRLVSKDELLETVWKGLNVGDSTLSSRITGARRALGDNGKSQKFIQTVPKKGFRFVGKVSEGHGPASLGRPSTRANAKQAVKVNNSRDDSGKDKGRVGASIPEGPTALRLPPLPALLIGREKDLTELKGRIGAEPETSRRRITVVRGWPGVGKTSFVNMLANDKEVMNAFPDGVLWAALGEA